jgi:hypothetical protein
MHILPDVYVLLVLLNKIVLMASNKKGPCSERPLENNAAQLNKFTQVNFFFNCALEPIAALELKDVEYF